MNQGLLSWPQARVTAPGLLSWPLGNWPVSEVNAESTPITAGSGIVVTPGGVAHTKTAWVELIARTEFSSDGFYFGCITANTGISDYLVDIAVGEEGSERVILEDVLYSSGGSDAGPALFYVPIPIQGGERVSARAQSNDTAAVSVGVHVNPVAGGMHRAMRCSEAVTYGAFPATTRGTQVDPGAGANTKGVWVEVARETRGFRFAVMLFGGINNAAQTSQNRLWDLGWGMGGGERVLVGDMRARVTSTELIQPHSFQVFGSIPAGERLVTRMQSSTTDATDRLGDLVVIGFR